MDEIPPGTHKLVPIGRHGVGVYNVNGTFYAIANYCPHQAVRCVRAAPGDAPWSTRAHPVTP
ncbi:rieske (2Fe-2S) domain-containing protein [Mycobacterium pseudoshottsii JCM 15466]|nr:rieske (2Fe-2S) domain-containing protein [Mycobacterium pseudoshottsii JCM 15466]